MSHFTVLVIGNNPEKQLEPYEDTYNPNFKCNWHLLGGRWTGFFKLKGNLIGKVGEPGIMTEPAMHGYCDQALKGEIDFATMRRDAADKAAKAYDCAALVLSDLPKHETWESVLARIGEENINQCRAFYNQQLSVVAWRDSKEIDKNFGVMSNPDDVSTMLRKDYIKAAYEGAISTWAIVKDGIWYEKGEMGWWAMTANEKNQNEWNEQTTKMLDELPDNTLLSLYDCHI